MQVRVRQRFHKGLRAGVILGGFAGETNDDVRAESEPGESCREPPHPGPVAVSRVPVATHEPEQAITPTLQRRMEMGRQAVGCVNHQVGESIVHLRRLDRRQPNADVGNVDDQPLHQGAQRDPLRQVSSVGADMNARQDQLRVGCGKPLGFLEDFMRRA